MNLLMPKDMLFLNTVSSARAGVLPHHPRGIWRSPLHYSDLKEHIIAAEQRVLSAAEVLLKYALNLYLWFEKKKLKPTRRVSADFTESKKQTTHNQGQALPKPTVTKGAAKAKAPARAGGFAGAALALCSLIFVPSPPGSGGKGLYMPGRTQCMDSYAYTGERLKP